MVIWQQWEIPPTPPFQQPPASAVAPPGRPWRSLGPGPHLPRRNAPGDWDGVSRLVRWGWMDVCVFFLNVSKTFLPKHPFFIWWHSTFESNHGCCCLFWGFWLCDWVGLSAFCTANSWGVGHCSYFCLAATLQGTNPYATKGEKRENHKDSKNAVNVKKCERSQQGIIWITKKNLVHCVWGS